MLSLSDLKIAPESLGTCFWLVRVAPTYVYQNGIRTKEISGYRYTVVLADKKMEQIGVKIDGPQRMEAPDTHIEVQFEGLEVMAYFIDGKVQIGARATGIRPAKAAPKS